MPNWITNKVKINANESQIKDILTAIQRDGDVYGSFDFNKLISMPASLDVTSGSITDEAIDAFISYLSNEVSQHPDRPGSFEDIKRYVESACQIKTNQLFSSQPDKFSPSEIDDLAERHDMSTERFLALGKQYLDNQISHGHPTWYEWSIKNWGTKWNLDKGSVFDGEDTLSFDTAWSNPAPIMATLSSKFPSVEFFHKWADEDLGYNVGTCTYLNGEIIDSDIPLGGSARAYEMAFEITGIDPAERCMRYDVKAGTYVYDESMEEPVTPFHLSIDNLIDLAQAKTALNAGHEKEDPSHKDPVR